MLNFVKKLNFEKIIEKGKPLLIAGICFAAVFLAGFGTGKSTIGDKGSASKRSLTNYTTNSAVQTKATTPAKIESTAKQAPTDRIDCYIKGSKSKIYHVPGGSFYERTNAAQCFNSEEEALSAGYNKSSH
jgi:hypothetical protein